MSNMFDIIFIIIELILGLNRLCMVQKLKKTGTELQEVMNR